MGKLSNNKMREENKKKKNRHNDIKSEEDYERTLNQNFELRDICKEAFFLPIEYDVFIRGFDVDSGSIVYDYNGIGNRWSQIHNEYPSDKDDMIDGSIIMKDKLNNLTPEELDGKISPMMVYDFNSRYIGWI